MAYTHLVQITDRIKRFISDTIVSGTYSDTELEYYAQDEGTKTIALFAEGLRAGSRFKEICLEISKKKPIIFLKAGLTKSGARAANSHTGSIAGSLNIYKSVFKQTGVIYADSIMEFIYLIDWVKPWLRPCKKDGDAVQNSRQK